MFGEKDRVFLEGKGISDTLSGMVYKYLGDILAYSGSLSSRLRQYFSDRVISGSLNDMYYQANKQAGDLSIFEEFDTSSILPIKPTNLVAQPFTNVLEWDYIPNALEYYVWVNGPSGNIIREWKKKAEVYYPSKPNICSITLSSSAAQGNYTFWIRATNTQGRSPWSNGKTFVVT